VDAYPVDEALPEIRSALADHGAAVLVAPPGAGKTTRIPLALRAEAWLGARRIVMLEPRRIAARSAARWMAGTLGEREGETVGFRVRGESRVGRETRVEVVTEGILTRILQSDPSLEGVGLVIFDEFHERNLHSDLGLALCLEARDVLRPDLRILVMSATLRAEPVASLLGNAPVVRSEGRSHPVDTRYLERRSAARLPDRVAHAVATSVRDDAGDILVFLPGASEIRITERLLHGSGLPATCDVVPLHGTLPAEAQDRAIRPAARGRRKVVLATSIAETSLTIEGVRVVIDGGFSRVPRFSPRTGLTRLATVPVTRAAADQRRGRAGRVAPGVCYRLWTRAEQAGRVPEDRPEILEADLVPLALELAAWGATQASALRWLDPPPAAGLAHAGEVLAMLGLLGGDGRITAHGRAVAGAGLHPRLAHMVVRGAVLGVAGTACDLAALLDDRDLARRGEAPPPSDVRLRLDALRGHRADRRGSTGLAIDDAVLRRVAREANRLRRRFGATGETDPDSAGPLLALAYPDRVGRIRRGQDGRFLLRSGTGATMPAHDPLAREAWIAVAAVEGAARDRRVTLAAPLREADIERLFEDSIVEAAEVRWDDAAGAVRSTRTARLGPLTLRRASIPHADRELCARAMLDGIRLRGIGALPWGREADGLRARIAFARRESGSTELPDLSDDALIATLEEWLAPWLDGITRWEELARLDFESVLRARLSYEDARWLDRFAPTHHAAPSGTRVPVDYADPDSPAIEVRLQEMFGQLETPRIADGAVPLTVRLLSPARRPVQVTRDLGSFWRDGYFAVRRELRGRYPKHYWPEDPLTATPTRRVRP
jgi:ATP-dependent helicase HrpB